MTSDVRDDVNGGDVEAHHINSADEDNDVYTIDQVMDAVGKCEVAWTRVTLIIQMRQLAYKDSREDFITFSCHQPL